MRDGPVDRSCDCGAGRQPGIDEHLTEQQFTRGIPRQEHLCDARTMTAGIGHRRPLFDTPTVGDKSGGCDGAGPGPAAID